MAGHERYKTVSNGELFKSSVILMITSRNSLNQVRYLNHGAFGQVLLGRDTQAAVRNGSLPPGQPKETEEVALKLVDRGPTITRYIEREIINHMRLSHPHIIGLKEVLLTPRHLCLVMEYAPGGDLFNRVRCSGGLCEPDARWFFQQIILAVDYCHRMGVASRDIKLENTLLTGGSRPLVKLADFGFSKDDELQSAPTSRVGTPAYLAPEVILAQPGQKYDGKAADLWSCGVLLFVMVSGSYPFQRNSDETLPKNKKVDLMLKRIVNVDYAFPSKKPMSESCKDLIKALLVKDPARRLTIEGVQRHPWFRQDLNPSVLTFNDGLIQQSKQNPVSEELLAQIRNLVQEAQMQTVMSEDELITATLMQNSNEEFLDEEDLQL